ncbi:unnamed protein product, partial [Diabrotica balteata]
MNKWTYKHRWTQQYNTFNTQCFEASIECDCSAMS